MADLRTEESFPEGALADAWQALIDEDPTASIFHSARFLHRWCEHLRRDCQLQLRFVYDDDRLIGVVPEVRDGSFVHFAGGEHVTDYLGPVSRPEDRGQVVATWFEHLADDDSWDRLVAAGLAEDAGWHELIAKEADRLGFSVDGPDIEDVCPRVGIGGGWAAYLDAITGKQRHEIRRKARKLARETASAELAEVALDDLHDAVDEFVTLHRTSAGEKGRFFVDEHRTAFFHGLVDEFGADRILRIHRLVVDGATGAITVSLVDGDWGLYNSAYDQQLRGLAPGMVLVGELIRMAAEEGHQAFDLLRGDEEYKYRFGAEDRRVFRLVVDR